MLSPFPDKRIDHSILNNEDGVGFLVALQTDRKDLHSFGLQTDFNGIQHSVVAWINADHQQNNKYPQQTVKHNIKAVNKVDYFQLVEDIDNATKHKKIYTIAYRNVRRTVYFYINTPIDQVSIYKVVKNCTLT